MRWMWTLGLLAACDNDKPADTATVEEIAPVDDSAAAEEIPPHEPYVTTPVEDCWDGIDNDSDGLLDCEDGDCAISVACTEDCTDTLDDDGDGLIDCEDDDCFWSVPCAHPAGVKVTLLSGRFEIHHFESNRYWHYTTYRGVYSQDLVHYSTVTGLSGIVQVLPLGVESWATATTSTTCAWTLEQARVVSRKRVFQWSATHTAGRPTRSGFALEDGCRLDNTSFLPKYLMYGRAVDSISARFQPIPSRWYNSRYTTSERLWQSPDAPVASIVGVHGSAFVRKETNQYGIITGSPSYWALP